MQWEVCNRHPDHRSNRNNYPCLRYVNRGLLFNSTYEDLKYKTKPKLPQGNDWLTAPIKDPFGRVADPDQQSKEQAQRQEQQETGLNDTPRSNIITPASGSLKNSVRGGQISIAPKTIKPVIPSIWASREAQGEMAKSPPRQHRPASYQSAESPARVEDRLSPRRMKPEESPVTILIDAEAESKITVAARPGDTMAQIKAKIQELRPSMPMELVILLHKGSEVEDSLRLCDYDVDDQNSLQLLIRSVPPAAPLQIAASPPAAVGSAVAIGGAFEPPRAALPLPSKKVFVKSVNSSVIDITVIQGEDESTLLSITRQRLKLPDVPMIIRDPAGVAVRLLFEEVSVGNIYTLSPAAIEAAPFGNTQPQLQPVTVQPLLPLQPAAVQPLLPLQPVAVQPAAAQPLLQPAAVPLRPNSPAGSPQRPDLSELSPVFSADVDIPSAIPSVKTGWRNIFEQVQQKEAIVLRHNLATALRSAPVNLTSLSLGFGRCLNGEEVGMMTSSFEQKDPGSEIRWEDFEREIMAYQFKIELSPKNWDAVSPFSDVVKGSVIEVSKDISAKKQKVLQWGNGLVTSCTFSQAPARIPYANVSFSNGKSEPVKLTDLRMLLGVSPPNIPQQQLVAGSTQSPQGSPQRIITNSTMASVPPPNITGAGTSFGGFNLGAPSVTPQHSFVGTNMSMAATPALRPSQGRSTSQRRTQPVESGRGVANSTIAAQVTSRLLANRNAFPVNRGRGGRRATSASGASRRPQGRPPVDTISHR